MDVTITASTYSGLVERMATLVVSGETLSSAITITQEVPHTYVYYTGYSTQWSPQLPNVQTSGWGATLISNTYDEIGILEFEGPVTNVPTNAFGMGYSPTTNYVLTSVILPDTVTTISENAFLFGCGNLTAVTLSSALTDIGQLAFATTALKSVTIPDSVTTIGVGAFSQCTALTSVIIGSGLTSMGNSVFYNNTSLSSITITATSAPTITNETFQDIRRNGKLYYPSGSNYSSWLRSTSYYLGYYSWTGVPS